MADDAASKPPESVTLNCTDGYPLAAKLFRADIERGTVVIAPALGVPMKFYAPFAIYLADQGFTTLTFDYRGSGASANGPVRGRDMRMQDWGRLDIEAALDRLRAEQPSNKCFLIGHSAGAQLCALAPSSKHLRAIILVAGSAPHLRHYPLRAWPKLLSIWYLLAPLLSWNKDDFPVRKVGLGSTKVAAGVVGQWARWARTRDYLFAAAHGVDTAGYTKLKCPLLSYCLSDDDYAPPAAVDALLRHFAGAQIERRLYPVESGEHIGHFGYFRDQHKNRLWRDSVAWLGSRL